VIVVMENFADTLQQCIAGHADQARRAGRHGRHARRLKGVLVNYVVRKVKKMVPAYSLPGAVRFKQALTAAARHPAQGGDQARRRGGAAVHRRHHRRGQGRGAAAPQRDRQHAAVLGVELRAAMEKVPKPTSSRPASARCRCITSSRSPSNMMLGLRTGGKLMLIPNPRDLPGTLKELSKHKFHSFPAVNTLFNGLANHPDFGKVDWST
jgi:long-chain acyl-CoA synthetase